MCDCQTSLIVEARQLTVRRLKVQGGGVQELESQYGPSYLQSRYNLIGLMTLNIHALNSEITHENKQYQQLHKL